MRSAKFFLMAVMVAVSSPPLANADVCKYPVPGDTPLDQLPDSSMLVFGKDINATYASGVDQYLFSQELGSQASLNAVSSYSVRHNSNKKFSRSYKVGQGFFIKETYRDPEDNGILLYSFSDLLLSATISQAGYQVRTPLDNIGQKDGDVFMSCKRADRKVCTVADLLASTGQALQVCEWKDPSVRRQAAVADSTRRAEAARADSIRTAAELKELGDLAPGSTRLSDLKEGDTLRLKADLPMKAPYDKYVGTIYQNGEQVGLIDEKLNEYGYTQKHLDVSKPHCAVSPNGTFYKSQLNGTSTMEPKNYGITIMASGAGTGLNLTLFSVRSRTESSSGVPESSWVCLNVNSVAELQSVIGKDRLEIYSKNLPKASGADAASQAFKDLLVPVPLSPASPRTDLSAPGGASAPVPSAAGAASADSLKAKPVKPDSSEVESDAKYARDPVAKLPE